MVSNGKSIVIEPLCYRASYPRGGPGYQCNAISVFFLIRGQYLSDDFDCFKDNMAQIEVNPAVRGRLCTFLA